MIDFIYRRPRLCAVGMVALAALTFAATSSPSASPPAIPRAPPPAFPAAILQELSVDLAADPEPDEDTAWMTPEEASEVSAAPAGRTWLDVCRARRTALAGYLDAWRQMADAQRAAIIAAAAATPEDAIGGCAARFHTAVIERGYRHAAAVASVRRAFAASQEPDPVPVARRIASAGTCQWFRDEIERDDHEAAIATTRDLREGWEHNRLGAENSYRDICR